MPARPLGIRLVFCIGVLGALLDVLPGVAWSIPCLSGFVRDGNGNPVVQGDLDFFNSSNVKLVTPGDNTDAAGFYNVCVLPDVYRVTYAPPLGTRLLGREISGVDLTGALGRALDVALETGTVLSGRVQLSTGGTLAGVDIDVDRTAGGRIFTPDDATDGGGNYRVVVPDGTYRVRFSPPRGTRWQGVQLEGVAVQGDHSLDVVLQPGSLLSGTVRDGSGAAIADVAIELRNPDGSRLFVANNKTDADGRYQIAVPTGTFTVRFTAPAGSRAISTQHPGFVIAGDTTLDASLESGVLLTAFVYDAQRNPLENANIDVIDPVSGSQVFTPADRTDAEGRAVIALQPGVYDVEFNPPPGTPFDVLRHSNVQVQRDTTVEANLGEGRRIRVLTRVADARGAPLPNVTIVARRPDGGTATIPTPASDAAGLLDLWILAGVYDVFAEPPRGAPYAGAVLGRINVVSDSVWSEIRVDDAILFTAQITDAFGRPLSGADLDFRNEPAGSIAFTPHDNSDAAGTAIVALRPGAYSMTITPPAGSGLAATTVSGIDVTQDTAATFALRATTRVDGRMLGLAHPNPFRASTQIAFSVPVAGPTTLAVYDMRGRLVRILESGVHGANRFDATWDGTGAAGERVASGVYVFRLQTAQRSDQRKVVLRR